MAGVAGSSKPQYGGVRANQPELLLIKGRFATNGATPTINAGKGFVVTQQGTGLYRVKPNINTVKIVSAVGTLIKAATSATFLELVDTTSANNYVTFRVVDATGAAAAPGAVTDQIAFDISVMTVKLPS